MPSPNLLEMDHADFVREVLQNKRSAVIGFSAEWCAPCRSMGSVFTNLSRAKSSRVLFGLVDIDDEPELVELLSVGSVPTLLFFESGFEVKRIFRTPNEAVLESMIEKVLPGSDS